MRAWIARLRRMRPADYITAVEVLTRAVWVEVAIRIVPFSRLLDQGTGRSSAASVASVATQEYQRLVRFVTVAYEILPFPGTCLRQSLVLQALLERRGVPSRVCLGVARNGPSLAAHAWIECDGATLDASAAPYGELQPHRG